PTPPPAARSPATSCCPGQSGSQRWWAKAPVPRSPPRLSLGDLLPGQARPWLPPRPEPPAELARRARPQAPEPAATRAPPPVPARVPAQAPAAARVPEPVAAPAAPVPARALARAPAPAAEERAASEPALAQAAGSRRFPVRPAR